MLRLRFLRVALRFFLDSYFVLFFRLFGFRVLLLFIIAFDRLDYCIFSTFLFIRRMFFFILKVVPYDILVIGFLFLWIHLMPNPFNLYCRLVFISWVPRPILFKVRWLIDFFRSAVILGLNYVFHSFFCLESGFLLILEIDVCTLIIPTPRFKWT
jgi:hypothetical protein